MAALEEMHQLARFAAIWLLGNTHADTPWVAGA